VRLPTGGGGSRSAANGFRRRLAWVCAALAVLLALFVLGIVFSPDRVQARAAGQPLLPGVLPQNIVGIDISVGGKLVMSLRRTASGWELPSGPRLYPASADRITTFLRVVSGLTRTSLVSRDATHLAELGLAPDSARLVVLHQAAGKPDLAFDVGARGPGGDADYVRVRGEQSVYLARGQVSFFLSQEPSSWYELHVLPDDVQGTTVSSVTVSGSVPLEEPPGAALSGGYTLSRPSADKLDQWEIEGTSKTVDPVMAGAMVSSLANLEGVDFADGAALGASRGGLRLAVATFAGKRYVLDVRRGPLPGRLWISGDWSHRSWFVNPLALQRAVLPESRLLAQ
jgi:Domain of unknown function (DUF4340)